MREKLIYKLKATSIHLLISLLIFAGILYLIFFQWYPEPFFTAQGGWQGIQLMAVVDLVLGPSLTFIVFNHLKKRKEIILDLTLIALVQFTALAWGGYSVYMQRPIALVHWGDTFYTVTCDDYSSQEIEAPDFSMFSQHIPPLIFARPVRNELEYEQFIQLSEKSVPAYAQIALYQSIEDNLSSIFAGQLDIEEVMANNSEMKARLEKLTGGNFDDYNYVALKAKYQNMILVMDDSGKIVGEVKAPYHNSES